MRRIVPRAVRIARRLQWAPDSIHRRGTRTHMPIHSPSRTRAAVARTLPELAAALAGRGDVALVPTMGALHDGHRALLRAARGSAATVVMSLFVNPAQFGPGEDFARYPRDEEADVAIAGDEGADVVFAPGARDDVSRGLRHRRRPRPAGRRARGPLAPRALPRRRHRRHAPLRARATAARVLRREGLPAARDRARRRARPRARRRRRRRPDRARRRRPRALVAQPLPLPGRARTGDDRSSPASTPPGARTPAASATPRASRPPRARLAVEPDYLELRRRADLGAYDPAAPRSCSSPRASARRA